MKNALSTAALIATLALTAWNAQAQVPSAEAGDAMFCTARTAPCRASK
ncbi:hypothetical protein [Diaphorobacter sp.]|nr:hypothetical protein [Diaphorobacter sp.]